MGKYARTFRRVVTVGLVMTLIGAATLVLGMRPARAASFVVTLATDTLPLGVAGELRYALNNLTPGPNSITFTIPGPGVHTINLAAALPTITQQVTIDGLTQSVLTSCGPAFNLLIELNGAAAGDSPGFQLNPGSTGSLIRGLIINNFNTAPLINSTAIVVNDTNGTVQCNLLGTNPAGTAAGPGNYRGVVITSTGALIGGTTPAARNVISGNLVGVNLFGASTTSNTIEGNYIGTNAAGSGAVPNQYGVYIQTGASVNLVGGTAVGAGNLISGNALSGVYITDPGTNANAVRGNLIGTNPLGTAALANGFYGVELVNGSTNTTVGGASASARNIISGNTFSGVHLAGAATAGNQLIGNYIGTDVTGTLAVPNTVDGVSIDTGAFNNFIGFAGIGNVISGNGANGITLVGAGFNNIIESNFIGTNASGTAALGNTGAGVSIYGGTTGAQVGGANPTNRNIISANGSNGVAISGATTIGNFVLGNYIGTDVSGTAALGNGTVSLVPGVVIFGGAFGNFIGMTSAGTGNLISGNRSFGVQISNASGNLVQQNLIGTTSSGLVALGNGTAAPLSPGVGIDGAAATNNVIGGATASARNVICSNSGSGVLITVSASGTTVQGNYIGVGSDGTTALGNGNNGVGITAGAANNLIGGGAPGQVNIIANNTKVGVLVRNLAGNTVRGNSIYNNAALGIDIQPIVGVNPNTPNGANNYPILSQPLVAGGNYQISGTLNASPSATYGLDFFASVTADPSGSGQGQTYLGTLSVTTDGSGNASFNANAFAVVSGQNFISATATDSSGNTSEFSVTIQATVPTPTPTSTATGTITPGGGGTAAPPNGTPGGPGSNGNPLILNFTPSAPVLIVGNNNSLVITAQNVSGQAITGLVLRAQIAVPLIIVSANANLGVTTINCQDVTAVIGTLLAGQTATLTVIARAPGGGIQPTPHVVQALYRGALDDAPDRPAAANTLDVVNVGAAGWDGDNLRTKAQFVHIARPNGLPITGEHPAENGRGTLWALLSVLIALGVIVGVGWRRVRGR